MGPSPKPSESMPGYAVYRCPECGEYRYLSTKAPRRRCILTRGCKGRAERVK